MFKINLFGNKKVEDKTKNSTDTSKSNISSSQKEETSKQQAVSGDLALAYLCPSQNNSMTRAEFEKELKKIKSPYYDEPYVKNPQKILDCIDYNNAKGHLKTFRLLVMAKFPNYYLNDLADNGYFSSDKGLEAIQSAKNAFSLMERGNTLSDFSQAIFKLSVDDWETIKQRDITYLAQERNPKNFYELASLSDEEFERTINSPFFKKGLNYVSENDDINQIFIKIKEKRSLPSEYFRKIEKNINQSTTETERKAFCELFLKNCNEQYFIDSLTEKIEEDDDDKLENFKFFAENTCELHELFHSRIPNFDDRAFCKSFSMIVKKITPQNIDAVRELINIGTSQHYLLDFIEMSSDEKTFEKLKDQISKIKNGEMPKEYLIPYNSAKINDKAEGLPEEYKHFDTPDTTKMLSSTSQGEVCFAGSDTYINHKGEMHKLQISAKTFKKLFPTPKDSALMQQQPRISDCYFISSTLYHLSNNKNSKYHILNLIKEDGSDLVVTFPGLKNNSVTFKNGELSHDLDHIEACSGIQLLEEAYLKAKSKATNTPLKNVYETGGKEYITFNEILPDVTSTEYISDENYTEEGQKASSKEEIIKLFSKISDNENFIICTSTKAQEAGELREAGINSKHSYAVNNIDMKNQTITLVNPFNTRYTTTLSFEQYFDKFYSINVCELKD